MRAIESEKPPVFPVVFPLVGKRVSGVSRSIDGAYLADETASVRELINIAALSDESRKAIHDRSYGLVESVRRNRARKGGLDAFLIQYDLSSQEGVILMCLAESLLRIPDSVTADKLIKDKIGSGKWEDYLSTSDSLFVNASTWGLMLTGRIIQPDAGDMQNPTSFLIRLMSRMGEPVVRTAMKQAMRIMGHQFVMGRSIEEALERSKSGGNRIYRHSFDMLGEAALTTEDADRYFDAYRHAIDAIGADSDQNVFEAPSISVKLSALYPRYELWQRKRALKALVPRLTALAEQARSHNIGLTVDAEEAARLSLSLEIFEFVYRATELAGWNGYGLAVQAYQRRAIVVVRWLQGLARDVGRVIPVRLVKGAYWDTEIKRAQEQGLESYPVFTRKQNTDVSYLACARELLQARDKCYPQFATHNAHAVASILHMAGDTGGYEFQRLHGMGEELYEEIIGDDKPDVPCRVYAPVGRHEDLLPYLVRRLLENGANTSFVNRIVDEAAPIDDVVSDPVAAVENLDSIPHPRIPPPGQLFGDSRKNSAGINLFDPISLEPLAQRIQAAMMSNWRARPLIDGEQQAGTEVASLDPADRRRPAGLILLADAASAAPAVDAALRAFPAWEGRLAAERAQILEAAADLFEKHTADLIALCVREAGKTVPDSISELREAVDFLRFYAAGARQVFGSPARMPGPTGESNELSLQGRGVFVCISPWNFPLAIFVGQVAAALAAGNTVVAKPAACTSLTAALAVRLLHQAGVPPGALNFLPGKGSGIGNALVADPRIAGVVFTGSTDTAHRINRQLAQRDGPIAVFIAETGGQNAMLVDSSALPEQVVLDVVQSAFNSAGQRCSALRVLFLQNDIADRVIELLRGYMKELYIGDPALLHTDVGPVIDASAQKQLNDHLASMGDQGKILYQCPVPDEVRYGSFFAPVAIEIEKLSQLKQEVFGPVLHVIRYAASEIDDVLEQINATGYGLTLGIHSRIDSTARHIAERVSVGNVYINRNMIGAVVGVQPFGGCGLSGTGPKAGGPNYLSRFATEKTLTINTAAVGGNTTLLSLSSD